MSELALELHGGDLDGAIERAKAGDLAAFEDLIRRHERLVLMTALRLTGNREDAQDVRSRSSFVSIVFWGSFAQKGNLRRGCTASPSTCAAI